MFISSNWMQYYEDLKKKGTFVRDFGRHQEEIPLNGEGTLQ